MKLFDHIKSNWLRYGFESLAVLVGILAAFALDNWNDQRKNRAETEEYLINIKDDLIADTLSINQMLEWGKNEVERIGKYYDFYNQQDWMVREIVDSCLNTGFRHYIYIPIHSTFVDMYSSGNTGLLDDRIRKELVELNQMQEELVIVSLDLKHDTKVNVHEVEKYWDMAYSSNFRNTISLSGNLTGIPGDKLWQVSEKEMLQGLKFHHNIFNWTYKLIGIQRVSGSEII